MTAHDALSHSFVAEQPQDREKDLLPNVRKNFNARRTLHAAIDTIRAINKLREGGHVMEGAMSKSPENQRDAAKREAEKKMEETSKGLWSMPGKT